MLAIGRARVVRPAAVLLDEPSLGLAPLVSREIFKVIGELPTHECAVLIVEQNARAALAVAARGYRAGARPRRAGRHRVRSRGRSRRQRRVPRGREGGS